MLIDLLLFIFFLVFCPYIVVGVLIGKILVEIAELFRLPVLFASVSLIGLGALALMHDTPDPTVPYSSVVEVFSQAHPLGLPMPYLCFGIAAILFGLAIKRANRLNA